METAANQALSLGETHGFAAMACAVMFVTFVVGLRWIAGRVDSRVAAQDVKIGQQDEYIKGELARSQTQLSELNTQTTKALSECAEALRNNTQVIQQIVANRH